jgi:peptidyl-prolyl cis-trans isomerase A (cyclophilin A)
LRTLLSFWRTAGTLILATALPLAAAAGTVRLHTSLGPIDVDLVENAAPVTVDNFLAYLRSGAYDSSYFHRSDSSVGIIQGGGRRWPEGGEPGFVPQRLPIALEYSDTRPNARGTMARGAAQNSATSEWFFNIKDNTTSLGATNGGGYAVFGRVTAPTLPVMDAIATLPLVPSTSFPVRNWVTGQTTPPTRAQVVLVDRVQELPSKASASASDRIFTYLEAAYPQYAAPAATAATGAALGYTYRYYAGTDAYVGTKDGQVFYLVPALSPEIRLLGTIEQWLAVAQAAGY